MQVLQPNSLLQGGKYRIERVLGQGGFGITYQAIQVALNRRVAIKEFFMKDYCERDADTSHVTLGSTGSAEIVSCFKEKFLKEATIIAQFDNPHIVRIYDIFEENGTAYYVMEYLEDRLRQYDQLVPLELSLSVIRQIGEALSYIHSQNVLHLDVKPSNILFRKDCPVLIDFGISKRYDAGGGQTSSTPVGISKGYAPLEQYNQGVQKFLPATDVYALGATLYKFLTGQTPPEASDVMNYGLPTDVMQARHVPENIIQAIKRSMDPRLVQRYQDVKSFMAALGNAPDRKTWNRDSPIQDVEESTIVQSRHNTGNIGNPEYRKRATNSEKPNHGSFNYLGLFFVIILFAAILFWLEGAGNNKVLSSSNKIQSKIEFSNTYNEIPDVIKQLEKDMVFVEGGTFMMGATDEQGSDACDDEKNVHQEWLSSFLICKHEVTQAEWEVIMGSNPSKFKGVNRPVENVSLDDCWTFIRKLNSITGKKFRLPTEAEWEYAARGGNKSKGYKYSGSNTLDDVAWYSDNSGKETHAVMTKQANELGLFDMSGNVQEECSGYVCRGGSWYSNATLCLVGGSLYQSGGDLLGFRLAL